MTWIGSISHRAARGGAAFAVAAVALLSCGAAAHADTSGPNATPGLAVDEVPGATLDGQPLSAPDGLVWSLARVWDEGKGGALELRRIAADGERGRTRLASGVGAGPITAAPAVVAGSSLTPLAGGDAAVVVRYGYGTVARHITDVRLLRVGADGAVRATVALPQPARRAAAFAIEPDGGLWWARSCRSELFHRSAAGSVETIRLPRLGCHGTQLREGGARLQLASDGALWLVNLCQRRIARVAVDGTIRQWRPRHAVCLASDYFDTYVVDVTVTADRAGGIAYESADGRIRGQVSAGGKLVESLPAPSPVELPDGRTTVTTLAGRDGGRWGIGGVSHTDYSGKVPNTTYTQPMVRFVAGDGSEQLLPLDAEVGAAATPRLELIGPDGALWAQYGERLLRITPAGLAAERVPTARAERVSGSRGRALWLELSCDAEVARWCRGSVRLRGAAAPTRFVIAGQRHGAVRLTLGARAVRALSRGRALRSTAVVRSDDAPATTRALVLR